VGREAALERQAQGRQLRPQLALGELGQGGGVCLTLAERAQHRPARGAGQPGRHRGQLDGGVLEQLLQAVGLTRALPDERLAIAGQVAQLARTSPCSSSWQSHWASWTSVLRPGTFLTCWALTSQSSKSSSSR